MESSSNTPLKDAPNVPLPTSTSNLDRLSLSWRFRSIVTTLGSFTVGLGLGVSQGMQTSGLRFRAENSHRFPTSSKGWYLYHKSKNYHVMLGGITEGLKMGSKVALWAGGFFAVEEAIDRLWGRKDFLSTLAAGLSVAGGFSLWSKFPLVAVTRTTRIGLYSGVGFGLIQDAISAARGNRLEYVDFILGKDSQRDEHQNRII